ncbi:hypothetical protein KIN20_025324 [Parelaphostrongylus tenuis]|uniref:Uncharacterized protein n=1 Tax=Parelaphostrongylus tenuis TaxID=148309 RepID=A0AAD5MV28_PARTN|nr:hypothetical protein KIN20_025324 [Parelaphostrongylus tenuis]
MSTFYVSGPSTDVATDSALGTYTRVEIETINKIINGLLEVSDHPRDGNGFAARHLHEGDDALADLRVVLVSSSASKDL